MRRYLGPVFLLALLLNAVVMDRTYSQDNTFQGKVGLSASLQASQVDILVPLWITNRFSIAPAFGMVWRTAVEATSIWRLFPGSTSTRRRSLRILG